MDLQLTNKRALITGSTSGIGFEIAKQLAIEGVEVIINGRTQENIDSAITRIRIKIPSANISGVVADFRDKNSVELLIDKINEVDILINNVGIYKSQTFEETTDEDWFDMFEVNVMSGVRLSRSIMPKMFNKNWGRILFISSECATLIPEDLIAYSTTKATLLSLSRGLAQTTTKTNITVNTILPGSTLTEGADSFLQEQAHKNNLSKKEVADNFFKNTRTSSLLQRFISVGEVASMAVYLSSPLSSATNGASIRVDGGSMGGI